MFPKLFLLILLSALFIGFSFSACSDDDESSSNELVGTTNAANEVKKYNSSSMPNFTYYPKNTLNCIETKDEDGHTAKTYKDLFGNVVLERRIDGNTKFDTYYVYNSLNQLSYVLQPMFQEADDLDKFSFKYTYDEYGRMKTKTIPGCEPVEYWYDNADRVVKMQDGILRDSLRYRVYEYDALGRMKKQSISDGKKTLYDEIINFYDTYDFIEECDDVLPNDYQSLYPYSNEDYGWSMLTGTRQLASNGEILLTTYGYDNHGRIISEIKVGLNNHYTSLETFYDFAGNVQYQWFDEYEYDWDDDCIDWSLGNRWGDIENKYNSKNNNLLSSTLLNMYSNNADGDMTSITDTINNLTYDILGKVTKNDRSGTSGDMSYSYDNLHGWLKQIKAKSKYGGFEQNLYRETGGSTPCYNGSISAMTWKNISDYLRRYDYEYDGLNRMTRAKFRYYKIGAGSSGSLTYTLLPSGGYGKQEDYSVDYEYDKNTNVSSIYRQGRLTIGDGDGYDTVEDDYIERNGNQLKKYDPCSVGEPYYGNFDFVNGADEDVEYSYDGNGNLTVDKNKGLTFHYDLLGHLTKVSSATADIDYVYAADGTKLQVSHKQYSTSSKKGTPKTSTSETYYGNLIYKNGKVSRYNFDGGFLSFNSKGSLYQSSCHLYIQDYQGNNRMLVSADNNGIEQNTHYYPYGELISDISTNPDGQDYKYGGKVLDRTYGLDLYDFHARQLDSKLGCFTSIDPMAEKYYGISPYAYCAGDPVNCIDPTGMMPDSIEAAKMCMHVYQSDPVELVGGWNCTRISTDEETGLQYGIYQRCNGGTNIETSVVFAGTDDFQDAILDLQQYTGSNGDKIWDTQYGQAALLSLSLEYSLAPGEELSFSGHSLGGALAQIASMMTGAPALTFNPAGINDNTITELGLKDAPTSQIQNFVKLGEIVNLSTMVNTQVNTFGKTNFSPCNYFLPIFIYQSLGNHQISNFQ